MKRKEYEFVDALRVYINTWLKKEGYSINDIAKKFNEYKKPGEKPLATSTISRFLNQGVVPQEDTIKKLARLIFRSSEATIDELNYKVLDFEKNRYLNDLSVNIGTGWTVWSSLITSLFMRQNSLQDGEEALKIPQNISLTMCDDYDSETPFWIKGEKEINNLIKDNKAIHKKYIADDLKDKLEAREIDAAFLLRPTFESMVFKNIRRPELVARIAVGHGTHIYCIRKKEGNDICENVKMETIDDVVAARDKLYDLINGKTIITVPIGNQTVDDQRERLLELNKIKDVLKERRKKISFSNNNEFQKSISELAEEITNGSIIMVIAFEPLNNHIFNSLQEYLNFEIVFYNFNLSKLVDDRSSYGLYASVDLIEDRERFPILVKFIKALHTYEKSFSKKDILRREIASFVSDMYYSTPNSNFNISHTTNTLMLNSLEDIFYSIQFLPFLETFIRLRK